MKMFQLEITLKAKKRGFHLITNEITKELPELKGINHGIANLFLKHTSASLTLNENADPSVRGDLESFFNDVVSNKPYFNHTYEGDDDMPAHIKSSLLGVSLNIPITNGEFNLGTWQGIYLNEHRDFGGNRKVIATIWGI